MHDEHPHPLLAQVPLTVSPFLALPTATPLPYTYQHLPSTLPPSVLSSTSTSTSNTTNPASNSSNSNSTEQQHQQPPAYVTSASGTTATPDQILASCLALQAHLQSLEVEARNTLQAWEEKRRAEDLAEKRRVAPGWLDGDVKLLRPENVGERSGGGGGSRDEDAVMGEAAYGQTEPGMQHRPTSMAEQQSVLRACVVPDSSEGEELDRAFGGMGLK